MSSPPSFGWPTRKTSCPPRMIVPADDGRLSLVKYFLSLKGIPLPFSALQFFRTVKSSWQDAMPALFACWALGSGTWYLRTRPKPDAYPSLVSQQHGFIRLRHQWRYRSPGGVRRRPYCLLQCFHESCGPFGPASTASHFSMISDQTPGARPNKSTREYMWPLIDICEHSA
jgi:hypothetical protein